MKVEVIKDRIAKVREIMQKNNIDVYMVVTGDYHISEYVGEYFKEREFITGFTGSAGTAVITMQEASLFTDGRYFVQAEKQLEGTGIQLMKMGVSGVPTLKEYIAKCMENKECFGFDGRTVPAELGLELSKAILERNNTAKVICDFDAVEEIFVGRAEFPMSKAFYLDEKYSGESVADKLYKVREEINNAKATCHVIATLDDVCYLFNIRGNDVECNPVIMAYAYVDMNKAIIYTEAERFDTEILTKLEVAGVCIKPYEDVYTDLAKLCDEVVLVDVKRVNMRLFNVIRQNPGISMITGDDPELLIKSIKNETEIKNLREIHYEDGAALTHFIFWLKKNVSKTTITEADAAKYLDNLRSQISDYIELSFDTISAYNANAAMMHYHADEDSAAVVKPEGMLLVDSGGQYLRGTTDVTRTIAVGPVTEKMKKYYTLTLKGMLALANAKFLRGCNGFSLDILARQPLWEVGMDYRCGTGHGVGYLLNVHESPNGFRWKHVPGKNDLAVIEPGMVTSDEPGVYIEDEFGIRIENEIVCVKDYENEYGEFLKFDMLTAVPIDLELVDKKYLDKLDIERLNNYHAWVREKLMPFFLENERDELINATRSI